MTVIGALFCEYLFNKEYCNVDLIKIVLLFSIGKPFIQINIILLDLAPRVNIVITPFQWQFEVQVRLEFLDIKFGLNEATQF